jgi:hypothetical protein
MTSAELKDIFASHGFKKDLKELSSYLASIKQERPIVHCLAKHLWKRGHKFQLEAKHKDLVVDKTHLEFKYSYDSDMAFMSKEFKKYGHKPLEEIRRLARAKKRSTGWNVMPGMLGDMCEKETDIFVWIICSRDLSKVAPDDLKRICWSKAQCEWNAKYPQSASARDYLKVVDLFLDKVQAESERPFSVLKEAIETNGDFPSTYHFILCEFSKTT